MFFALNHNTGLPIYRQIFNQFRQRILAGELSVDQQLPSVRELSETLKVTPITVAKAYQILENEGFVETRRGLGTFVNTSPAKHSISAKKKLLSPSVEQLVTEARALGLNSRELQEWIHQEFSKQIYQSEKKKL
ncbi:MAG: GntR family transcriptional regulator [Verrucomicrobiia bacterium]